MHRPAPSPHRTQRCRQSVLVSAGAFRLRISEPQSRQQPAAKRKVPGAAEAGETFGVGHRRHHGHDHPDCDLRRTRRVGVAHGPLSLCHILLFSPVTGRVFEEFLQKYWLLAILSDSSVKKSFWVVFSKKYFCRYSFARKTSANKSLYPILQSIVTCHVFWMQPLFLNGNKSVHLV